MDKLSALTSFVRAVELGSFSAAAEQIGVSQPAVSQQVRALEDSLGIRLINRTTRRLALTEAGEKYHAYATDIVDRLAEAERSVQSEDAQMSGTLSIGMPVGFSDATLGPFLIEFKKLYPRVILNVSMSDAMADIVKERLDVTIRAGEIRDESLIVRKLGLVERCLVAAPDYLDRAGRPLEPSHLPQKDYLLYAGIHTGTQVPLIGPTGEKISIPISPVMTVNNPITLHDAALAGLGIGLAKRWQVLECFQNGTLEEVLPGWTYPPQPIHAVYPSNRYIPLKVKHFVGALSAYLDQRGAFKITARTP